MNKGKKLTAAVAASAVASALVAPAAFASATFTDTQGHWAADYINALVEAGIVNGKSATSFDPEGKITRAEFAKIIVLANGLETEGATEAFADVDGEWFAPYVAAAAEAGIINGMSEDKFGPNDLLTREQMAVMFVRALGVDVEGKGAELTFADKSSISAWAQDAVAYAVELGLINGMGDNKFAPQGTATRAQVAKVANLFLDVVAEAELASATYVDKNTVTLGFTKGLDALAAADVTVSVKASGAAVAVTSVELAEDGKTATLKTSDLVASTTYTVTVGETTVELTTPVAETVELSKVSAINLKQVKVEFSGEVDATTAETVANYSLTGTFTGTGTVVNSATLLADNKTVILTLGGVSFQNQGSYKLSTTGLKAKNGVDIDDVTNKSFSAFDNALPVANEVSVVGPRTLKVTFSAPITDAPYSSFTLNSGSVSVYNPVIKTGATEYSVLLNVGADLPEGTHTLDVAGVLGYNGLKNEKQSLSFTYAKDVTAPTVAVDSVKLTSTTTSQAVLKYSEPVNLSGRAEVYAIYNGVAQYVGTITPSVKGAVVTQESVTYYDTYTVDFGVVLPAGTVNFFVNNVDSKDATKTVVDLWGNKFADATVSGNLAIDTVAPLVTKVAADGQTKVVFTFSEGMDEATAETRTNYTFYKEDGTVLTGTGLDGAGNPISAPVYNATDKTVTITGLNLAGGNFKVEVKKVKDLAIPAQNAIATATFTFNVVDVTAPTVQKALYTNDQKNLFVYFSKAMDTASITDLNNYELNDVVLSTVKGATATAIGNNVVKISFANAYSGLFTAATFDYGRLKDAQGNYTSAISNTLGGGIRADFITAADIINVKAISKDTVTFEVKQQLSSIDLNRFRLQGETVGQAYFVNQKVDNGQVDGALVTLKLASTSTSKLYSNVSNFTGLNILAAATGVGSALTNTNGNGLETDQDIAVIADAIAPTIASITTADENTNNSIDTIVVTFSELMKRSSIGLDSFTVAGYTVTDVQADVAGNTTTFKIKVQEKSYIDADNKPTVTLAKDAMDALDNVIKSGATTDTTDGI